MAETYQSSAAQLAGVTGSRVIVGGGGILTQVIVIAPVAGGNITLTDANAVGGVTPANTVLVIPQGTPAASIFSFYWNLSHGLAANYDAGATGTINLKGFIQ